MYGSSAENGEKRRSLDQRERCSLFERPSQASPVSQRPSGVSLRPSNPNLLKAWNSMASSLAGTPRQSLIPDYSSLAGSPRPSLQPGYISLRTSTAAVDMPRSASNSKRGLRHPRPASRRCNCCCNLLWLALFALTFALGWFCRDIALSEPGAASSGQEQSLWILPGFLRNILRSDPEADNASCPEPVPGSRMTLSKHKTSPVLEKLAKAAKADHDKTKGPRPTPEEGAPLKTVEELEKLLFTTREDAKAYFLRLAKDQTFIEGTVANLLKLLDKTGSETLTEEEMMSLLVVLVKKCCSVELPLAPLWTFPTGTLASTFYNSAIVPYTTSPDKCANKFDIELSMRNTLLFSSGVINRDESQALAFHNGKIGKIEYDVVKPPVKPAKAKPVKQPKSEEPAMA